MCLICSEWQKGKLTTQEAFRNLGEQLNLANEKEDHDTVTHLVELSDKLMDAEIPFNESDEDLDRAWWEKTHGQKDE